MAKTEKEEYFTFYMASALKRFKRKVLFGRKYDKHAPYIEETEYDDGRYTVQIWTEGRNVEYRVNGPTPKQIVLNP